MKPGSIVLSTATLLLCFALLNCKPRNTSSVSITGGSAATANDQFSASTISLAIRTRGIFEGFCTATIVAENALITAKHCVDDLNGPSFAFFGPDTSDLKSVSDQDWKVSGMLVETEKIFLHRDVDLAIVKLRKRIPAGHKIAELVDVSQKYSQSQDVVAAGFGLGRDRKSNTILNYAKLEFLNENERLGNILVSGNLNGAICKGDSGGSVYLPVSNGAILLAGVISQIKEEVEEETTYDPNDPTEFCHKPTFAVDVRKYKDWIQKSLNGFSGSFSELVNFSADSIILDFNHWKAVSDFVQFCRNRQGLKEEDRDTLVQMMLNRDLATSTDIKDADWNRGCEGLLKVGSLPDQNFFYRSISPLARLTLENRFKNFILYSRGAIDNLADLEQAYSLNAIQLPNNKISNIQPLKNLFNLTRLELKNNQISDVGNLQKLINLYRIDLSGNKITDPSPIWQLPNIEFVDLSNNPIPADRKVCPSNQKRKIDCVF
jgi:hypothetical protein